MIEIGEAEARVTAKGTHTGYKLRVYHSGLNDVRYLTAADLDILQGKLDNLIYSWEQKWERKEAAEARKETANLKARNVEESKEQTKKAQIDLDSLHNLLRDTLTIDDTVDWSALKNTSPFKKPKPKKPNLRSFLLSQNARTSRRQFQSLRSSLAKRKKYWTDKSRSFVRR